MKLINSLFRRYHTLFGMGFIFCFAVLLLNSCASTKTLQKHYVKSLPLVKEGKYVEAAKVIEEHKGDTYKEKDRALYYLDHGMLLHWAGEYKKSNEMLTQAEIAIEELYTKSVSKGLASAVLNDNALDYWGEDYEDIYLNVFKGLNYIAMDDTESAHVEVRRVQNKLNVLEDKYKTLIEEYNKSEDAEAQLTARENRFHNDVLARYLSLLLYRTEGSLDDARIDLEAIDEAWISQAQLYDFEKPSLPSIEMPEEEQALVNIISFTGLNPVKRAITLYINSGMGVVDLSLDEEEEDSVGDSIGFHDIAMPNLTGGSHMKIQLPVMKNRGSSIDRILVKLNGETVHQLSRLENMDSIARETFLLKQPLTTGKTIVRAMLKTISKEAGKTAVQGKLTEELGSEGMLLGLLAGVVADVAVDATENADLRISQFFPAHVDTAEFTVEPANYQVIFEYWDGDVLVETIDHGLHEFHPNKLNLVESFLLK